MAKKVRINHKTNILVLNDVEMAMVRRSLKVRAERLHGHDDDAGTRALVANLRKLHVDLGGVM